VWCDATASSFVAKVGGEVFTHFHAVVMKRHSSMWNWLFGLSEQILYEQSPWCQNDKENFEHALDSSPVSPFSVSVSLDFPRMAHAFFPECLSNYCHGICWTFVQDLPKILCCCFVRSIAKSHQARHTTPNKRT
jgi:hypothetical protein